MRTRGRRSGPRGRGSASREPERIGALDDERVGCGMSMPDSMIVVDIEHVRIGPRGMRASAPRARTSARARRGRSRTQLLELPGRLVDRLDAVVQVERSCPPRACSRSRALDELLVVFADRRTHRPATGRRRLDDRDVAEPGERHVEGSRNRRRGEREDVDLEPERAQELLLAPRRSAAPRRGRPDREILGITSRERTRWVPTRTSTLPSWNSCRTCVWSARERNRDTISTRTGKSR